MSKQSRYNQLLFLTTFSVYMGLVLMGGASPALAQAAMARGFDLKVEQEFKDDLDKKPDNDEENKETSDELQEYLRANKWFVQDVQELAQAGKFDSSADTFSLTEESSYPCGESKTHLNVSGVTASRKIGNQLLEKAVVLRARRFEGFEALADCLSLELFEWKHIAEVGIELNYDGTSLKISAFLKKENPQRAELFCQKLRSAYQAEEPDEDDRTEKLLYENTRITSDNDQVFIVTNLPRAGLESLLAVK